MTDQTNLERRKNDFISMASHELKTPLTTIKAFTQLLTSQPSSSAEQIQKYLSKIETQTNRLMKLINDMLDVSKIRGGTFEVVKENIEAEEVVEKAIDQMRRRYPDYSIRLIRSGRALLFADRERLQQVVSILLHNAIKYSLYKKNVDVVIKSDNRYLYIDVVDYGIGISEKDQKKLFQSLYRVVNPDHKEFPGLGMGLYIASEIVRCHKGRIGVRSQIGKGSVFSVKLPVVQGV